MKETIIQLKNITKSYDRNTMVIDGFNLEIKKGEFVTLLGPSGCGKTTILRMIGGFERPTSGEILLNGRDITALPPHRRPINTVFQKYALFPNMNIYDNIAFGLKLKKLPKAKIRQKVEHVLEVVDLEGFEKRDISTLSGGQQQRIAIARAIVNEPEILLLDEPLGALDYKMRREMQLELKQMHRELGITFLFVTHDQEEALTMSDKIVVMADGKIQQAGTPREIYCMPSNAFVADFIGESNIFDGVMVKDHRVRFCGREFSCRANYRPGLKIEAVIRPEDIVLTKVGEGQLSGEVVSCVFKGIYHEVTVQCEKNEVVVQTKEEWCPGKQAGLLIPEKGIHLVPYNVTKNHFTGVLDAEMWVRFADFSVRVAPEKIFPDAVCKEGGVYTKEGVPVDVAGCRVDAYFRPNDACLSDDADEGNVRGHIISIIYKGDHYSYIVRSKNGEDYFVNDEYLWNVDDFVSVVIAEDKIVYHIEEA